MGSIKNSLLTKKSLLYSVEIYTSNKENENGKWEIIEDAMAVPRKNSFLCHCNKKIYIVGGSMSVKLKIIEDALERPFIIKLLKLSI